MPERPFWQAYRSAIHPRWFDFSWFEEKNLDRAKQEVWDAARVRGWLHEYD